MLRGAGDGVGWISFTFFPRGGADARAGGFGRAPGEEEVGAAHAAPLR